LLISETVETKWNSRTKKYYELLGYIYTKMKDSFIVDVYDLKDNSMIYVDVRCEYCGEKYSILWLHRTKMVSKNIKHKDCCLACTPKKASETMLLKYNSKNAMYINEFKEKQKQTVLNNYGCENVFQSEEVKNNIRQGNYQKYGVESYTQTEECQNKRKETCLLIYGETSHMKTKKYKLMFTGKNNPVWKGGIRTKRTERITNEYKEWRLSVFERDSYECSKCHQNSHDLQAHHILSWRDNEDKRYDVDNGITLCLTCHQEFHKIYGKTIANRDDLLEFIQK